MWLKPTYSLKANNEFGSELQRSIIAGTTGPVFEIRHLNGICGKLVSMYNGSQMRDGKRREVQSFKIRMPVSKVDDGFRSSFLMKPDEMEFWIHFIKWEECPADDIQAQMIPWCKIYSADEPDYSSLGAAFVEPLDVVLIHDNLGEKADLLSFYGISPIISINSPNVDDRPIISIGKQSQKTIFAGKSKQKMMPVIRIAVDRFQQKQAQADGILIPKYLEPKLKDILCKEYIDESNRLQEQPNWGLF